MDSFTLDFGQLAQETMNFANPSINDFLDSETMISYPEGPGVIYTLQKGKGTFGMRGIPVLSLSDILSSLESNRELLDRLRLDHDSDFSAVECFQTESYEGAEVLVDTMMNRRFPYQEDMICNISDPGFSWWGNFSQKSFEIHFLSHQVERSGHLVRLGPVGDRKIAAKRFKQFFLLFSQYINKENFICTEKVFSYSVENLSGIFFDLKNLFFMGIFSETLKTLTSLDKTLYYYLEELATARRFWLEIEQKVKTESEQSSLFFS